MLCTDCEENNLSEGDLWMDRSRIEHPLAKYGTVIPPSHKNPSTKTLVGSSSHTAVRFKGANTAFRFQRKPTLHVLPLY